VTCNNVHHEGVAPGAAAAFHRVAYLAGMLFQKRPREAAEPGEMLPKIVMPSARLILSVQHIQNPMTRIFNPPVAADGAGDILDVPRQAAEGLLIRSE
jgi:hypothetical protein